jgi:hypothetical protein
MKSLAGLGIVVRPHEGARCRRPGWFSREERTLGTIEPGRLADLVVLNADVGKVVFGNPATLQ